MIPVHRWVFVSEDPTKDGSFFDTVLYDDGTTSCTCAEWCKSWEGRRNGRGECVHTQLVLRQECNGRSAADNLASSHNSIPTAMWDVELQPALPPPEKAVVPKKPKSKPSVFSRKFT